MFTLRLSVWNVWLLSLLLVAVGASLTVFRKGVATRLSDMTGYTARERLFTVLASLAPYPFLIATVWTPFTTLVPLLILGISAYVTGVILFAETLRVVVQTPRDEPFSSGPYRYSRNPLYVAATIVFGGSCRASDAR